MQLIVCCDGTWNDPDDRTHIHRICQAGRAALPVPENVFYDKGVGLEPGRRLSGGALGKGLSENVREAYRWLVRRYADGAEIYVFGFSRGAYTARSLAGLMNYAGSCSRRMTAPPKAPTRRTASASTSGSGGPPCNHRERRPGDPARPLRFRGAHPHRGTPAAPAAGPPAGR